MKKTDIHQKLFQLTETEQAFSNGTMQPNHETYKDFEHTLLHGEKVYLYTFEKHLLSTMKKNDIFGEFLENSQLLIFKHARYSTTPFHMHDFIEMNYVYSGTIEMVINGQQIRLKQGDFCILDTNVVHKISKPDEKDILINFLMKKEYFSTAMLSRLSSNSVISKFAVDALSESQKHNQFILFETENNEFLVDAVEGLLLHYYFPAFYSKETIDAYMIIIFSELLKAFQEKQSRRYKEANQHYIVDILAYIEKNFDTCTLKEVAQTFGFNTSYLSRYIKKNAGLSFIEIIQDIRLKKACVLLENSSMTIDEIAQQVGYRNLTFFYEKFRQSFGMSPKDFREKSL